MVEAKDIHKSFHGLEVLKGVDVQIGAAEVISIVGPSGAGKTTLLQIMGTLENPDRGSVLINGQDTSVLGSKDLAAFRNENIGFVFQFHHLLPEFSAMENVMMPGLISGKKAVDCKARAIELMEVLGVAERAEHRPSEMSGGEQQRVAVARALFNGPKVIFADEPSGNLDSQNAELLHNLFFQLRDEFSQTFVIVTHNMELAGMADRRLVMADGLITNE
jgi:lipoprotein-releasing system ATP-binding protein